MEAMVSLELDSNLGATEVSAKKTKSQAILTDIYVIIYKDDIQMWRVVLYDMPTLGKLTISWQFGALLFVQLKTV